MTNFVSSFANLDSCIEYCPVTDKELKYLACYSPIFEPLDGESRLVECRNPSLEYFSRIAGLISTWADSTVLF